jgi:hypothetical protein
MPPRARIRDWPLNPPWNQDRSTESMGFCMAIIVDIPNNKRTLKTMASIIPINLALGCSLRFNLFDAMVINMMLSIPRTISKKVRVNRLIQTAGSVKSGSTNEVSSSIILKIIIG